MWLHQNHTKSNSREPYKREGGASPELWDLGSSGTWTQSWNPHHHLSIGSVSAWFPALTPAPQVRQSSGLTPAPQLAGRQALAVCRDGCPATSRELALLPGSPPASLLRPSTPDSQTASQVQPRAKTRGVGQQWPGLPGPGSSWRLCPGMQRDVGEGESPSLQSEVFLPVFSQGR